MSAVGGERITEGSRRHRKSAVLIHDVDDAVAGHAIDSKRAGRCSGPGDRRENINGVTV